ncbi:hypothetical protein [Pseudomonas sp. MHK4]|jgi:quinol monooxygenase YgiN
MSIEAVTTLEISFTVEPNPDDVTHLYDYAKRMRSLPGCLGYDATTGNQLPFTWIMAGYWSCPKLMIEHYTEDSIDELIIAIDSKLKKIIFRNFPSEKELQP